MPETTSNEAASSADDGRGAFTPARIVALALIALTVAGLVYLHFAQSGPVSVPDGARAGELTLHGCDYGTKDGSYDADCGTLVVPENRHDARSRLIALPVKRIRARSASDEPPVFRLQGGPGITNMAFPDASRFAEHHDVVLVGYRGVDGSSKLDCPEVVSSREHAKEFLTQKAFRADAAAYEACARRLQDDGFDLAGYSLPQRVDDLEAARRALGYDRVDLISESLGTRTAMIYSWRYPKRVHRSVMIGVNPPGRFLWDAQTTGDQIRRYAARCAADAACRERTPNLTASLHSAYQDVPDRWWFLPVKGGNVEFAGFFGLMNATTDGGGPLSGPMTIDMLLDADDGDGSGAWLMSVMAQLLFPRGQVWGEVAATARSDAAYARQFFAEHKNRGSVIGAPGTDLIWAGGRLLDAWPATADESEYTTVRDSNVETLLVGGALDFATPPQNGTRQLLPHLQNGHEVVLPDIGHTDDFWVYQPEAADRLINTFLDSGRVDSTLYKRTPVDFTPATSDGMIAKIVVGVMLALALLTVLSLLWLGIRRRAFGPKARGALRSAYAILLGLGGWVTGALIVLVAFPTVPLTDELLVTLSVGLAVGLGIYFTWADGGWTGRTRAFGLAAAAGGSLLGAWLGFNVTSAAFGMASPVLAIVGAVAGGNLGLLGLDIAWDRQARDRFAEADAKETVAAPASTV